MNRQAGRVRGVGLVALLLGLVGLFVAWRQTRRPDAESPPPRAPVAADSLAVALADSADESAIARALAAARGLDSLALKRAWVDELPEFALAELAPETRALFVRLANARDCTCGCGYTLAACRIYDSSCPESRPALDRLLDSLRAGHRPDTTGLRAPAR